MTTHCRRQAPALLSIAVAVALAVTATIGTSAQPRDGLRQGSVKARVLRRGKGWMLIGVEGRRLDGKGIRDNVYRFDGIDGLNDAPLTPEMRALLGNDKDWLKDKGTVAYFGESALKAAGRLVHDYVVSCQYTVRDGVQCRIPLAEAAAAADAACPDQDDEQVIQKDVQKSFLKRFDVPPFGPAEAQVDVAVTMTGPVRVRVPYRKRMVRDPLGQCSPVGFQLKPIVISGEPVFGFVIPNIGGTFSHEFAFNTLIADETLGELAFAIGAVPVTIEFALAEKAGLTIALAASAKASLANVGASLPVEFSYTCEERKGVRDACHGTTTVKPVKASQPQLTGLTISGEAALIPWVSVVLRAGLYTSIVDSVFVGVSPYGKASLWGALPTPTCDVDGDGHLDTVTGTLLDADVGVRVLAGFSSDVLDTIRNLVPFNSNSQSGDENPLMVPLADLPFHFIFIDAQAALDGAPSAVLNPIARADAGARVGQEVRVRFRMNDCYPFADAMDYRVEWGDGTTPSTVTFAPSVEASAGHTYATSGQKIVKVTAVRDDHATGPSSVGRLIDRSRTLTINVAQ